MTRCLLTIALLAVAGAASAQGNTATAQTKMQAEAAADAKVDRFCIRDTGSRIPVARRADSDKDRKSCVASQGRVYTRQDIDASGRADLGQALRALDPSIR